jgi:enoyl-CoA hydratase/carnithine racemase
MSAPLPILLRPVDDAPGVFSLVLDRPSRAHAYTHDMMRALGAAVAEATAAAARVVVVHSTGEGAFCGGADHASRAATTATEALALPAQAAFAALAAAPFLSIAAVQGAAVGGGFELALACDLRVLGPRARFWLPELSLGFVPAAGGLSRLPALIGGARAREIILGGAVLDAPAAAAAGLGTLADDPLAAALARARALAPRLDPLALRLAKAHLDAAPSAGLPGERLAAALLYQRQAGG